MYDKYKSRLILKYKSYIKNNKLYLYICRLSELNNYFEMLNKQYGSEIILLKINDLDELVEHYKLRASINYSSEINLDISNELNQKNDLYAFACQTEKWFTGLVKSIPSSYELSKINFYLYGNSYVMFHKKLLNPNKIIIRIDYWGYGDLIIMSPILQYLIQNKKTTLIVDKNKLELSQALHKCKHEIKKSYSLISEAAEQIGIDDEYEVYDIAYLLRANNSGFFGYNIFDIFRDILRVSIPSQILINDAIYCIEALDFNKDKKHCMVIGYSFQSLEALNSEEKKWETDEIYKFMLYCANRNIMLVNLTPVTADVANNFGQINSMHIDFSNKSFVEIFGVIKSCDLVISLDSTCGHIAAALNVPNITLWNYKHTKVSPQYDHIDNEELWPISFRPYRKNVSIVSFGNKIEAGYVIDLLKKFIMKELPMKEEYITYNETKEDMGIIYI